MTIFKIYHYNHQGSVALVTWQNGTIRQHLQYLPYGGLFVDQRPNSYASTYTFSAKEKDAESGYTYFGARYYSDNMMMWLSVDPMSDERPNVSPYSYCQNNPIGRIDPSGALDGDYYTFKGKYLGKDGKDDHNVFFVKNDDKNSIRTIKSNNRKGLTTQSSDVNVAVSTNQETLKETLDVFYRTWENSGGNREEASVVSPDGSKILRGETGTEGRTKLPSMEGNDNTSIHSHAYGDYTDHDGSYWYTPSEPSKKDEATFMHNRLNIIVGLEKPDNDGNRIPKANFYNRKTESLGSMEINRIKKVLK